jgi:chromosome segregation ATPase
VYKTARLALALLAALSADRATAQVQRSGGSVNAQLMQQYQQVVSERTQLQSDNAKLKKDLDELKKQFESTKQQLATAKAGVNRSQSELASSQASNDKNLKSLDDTNKKMQLLVARFKGTIGSLQGVEAAQVQLQQQLAQSKDAYDKCAQANYALYQVNGEVLDRYRNQSPVSYLARAEPFTRLKQTQIDNLVVEYRQRAEELRLRKDTTPRAPVAPQPKQ